MSYKVILYSIEQNDCESFFALCKQSDYEKYIDKIFSLGAISISSRLKDYIPDLDQRYKQFRLLRCIERDDIETLKILYPNDQIIINKEMLMLAFDNVVVCNAVYCDHLHKGDVHIPHTTNFLLDRVTNEQLTPVLYNQLFKGLYFTEYWESTNYQKYNKKRELWCWLLNIINDRNIDIVNFEKPLETSILSRAVAASVQSDIWECVEELLSMGFSPHKTVMGKSAIDEIRNHKAVEIYDIMNKFEDS